MRGCGGGSPQLPGKSAGRGKRRADALDPQVQLASFTLASFSLSMLLKDPGSRASDSLRTYSLVTGVIGANHYKLPLNPEDEVIGPSNPRSETERPAGLKPRRRAGCKQKVR